MLTYNSQRNDGIDILRGFSIVSVILTHCYIHMPFANKVFSPSITNIIFRSGYYSVILFFVISGFLITTLSIRRWGNLSNISYRQFYQMRFARIMPCFLVLLIILSFLDITHISGFIIHTTSLSHALFSGLTFHINYLEAKTGYLPANWDVLWTLSIEEVFYLFFPLLCIVFKKPYYFIGLMILFIIIGPFARTLLTHNDIWSDRSYLSCMDGIAAGCLAALASRYVTFNNKKLWILLFLGFSLFLFIFIFRKQAYNVGISTIGLNVTLLEIGMGLILMGSQEWYIQRKHSGSFWCLPLRWLGRNSYEIYLIHSFFVIIISKILFMPHQSTGIVFIWYVSVLVFSGTAGQLTACYFSEPLNKYIRSRYTTSL
jgi:peptidoglycan/LPS O-acetylase OafA/YrhL